MALYTVEELEVMLKQAYAQQAGPDQQTCEYGQALKETEAVRATGGFADCQNPQRPRTTAESKLYNLDEIVYASTFNGERAARIRDILTRHPEFFEFLEVLNSGLV